MIIAETNKRPLDQKAHLSYSFLYLYHNLVFSNLIVSFENNFILTLSRYAKSIIIITLLL